MKASIKDLLNSHKYLLLILIFSVCLLTIYIDKPFYGHHDYNGAVYSNIARNFNRYGILNTKFGQVNNPDKVSRAGFSYMTHHPPMLTILLSFSFKIFGESERAARLVPIMFSLLTLVLIYAITFRYFDKKTALLGAVFASLTPMFIYFGKLPVQEVLGLPLVLLSIYLYFRFLKLPDKNRFLLLIGSLVIGNFTSWPVYYLGAIFALHYLFFGKPQHKLLIVVSFPLVCLATFMIYIFDLYLVTGNTFGGGLSGAFFQRLNAGQLGDPAGLKDLLILQIRWLNAFYGKILIGLAAITSLYLVFKVKRFYKEEKYQILAMLLLVGVAHLVVFRGVAQYHDYFLIYLLPFIVISAAVGTQYCFKLFKLKRGMQIVTTILLLALVLATTFQFTKALINSNEFKEAVDVGKYINSHTKSGDEVLILSPEFKKYFEGFPEYYSGRRLDYEVFSQKQLEPLITSKKYKLILAMPKRDTDPQILRFLNGKLNKSGYEYQITVYHE